jgi:signal recognition particle GTPase
MAIALARELGLPTAFLGTGEQYRDFLPFSLSAFLDDFLGTGR